MADLGDWIDTVIFNVNEKKYLTDSSSDSESKN